jgi:hypothetical protein
MTSNKTIIASAFILSLGLNTAQAGTFTSASFTMLDPLGGLVGSVDNFVTGNIDLTASTFAIASPTPFFGLNWTAVGGTIFGPGSYTFDTVQGGSYTGVTVGANQIGGHILFNWGNTSDIDVVMVWDVGYSPTGIATYTSTDATANNTTTTNDGILSHPDGIRGLSMIDGAFVHFNANFDFADPASVAGVNITTSQSAVTTTFLLETSSVTIDSGHTGAGNYQWNLNTDTPITAAATTALTGAGANTLTFNPIGLSGTHTVSVTVTDGTNSTRADQTIFITPFTMPAGDSDGDGAANTGESTNDNDNDGIPDYLDHSGYTANTTLQTSITGDTNSSVMLTDLGTLALGNTALDVSLANIAADSTSTAFGPVVAITDLANDVTQSSCVGGCFDFKVTGLNAAGGDSVQLVIPLSTAIPDNPVYRKYNSGSGWAGFDKTTGDSIASAAALSAGPVTCPAPGSAAYTTGLTPGNFCIQLTIADNGPNDANDTLGIIADPGGVASTNQFNPESASKVDGVAGISWLLMGLPALLGLRRFTLKK